MKTNNISFVYLQQLNAMINVIANKITKHGYSPLLKPFKM